MAKKKKGGASQRPQPVQQNSMRRDIAAAQQQNLSLFSDDPSSHDDAAEGLDIADELLATLDARDRSAAQLGNAPNAVSPADPSLLAVPGGSNHTRRTSDTSGKSGHSHTSGISNSSGAGSHPSSSPVKGAAEKILHAGERLLGHGIGGDHRQSAGSSSTSPPPVSQSNDVDGELATDMQQKGSIRRLFASGSPSKDIHGGSSDVTSPASGPKKISRQRARMVRTRQAFRRVLMWYRMKLLLDRADTLALIRHHKYGFSLRSQR